MAVRLIATTSARTTVSGGGGYITTPAINTTGANALFFYTNSQGGVINVFDSAGNSWVTNPPTLQSTIARFTGSDGVLWYALPPIITSASHTFWAGGPGISLLVAAFDGVATTAPYDTESAGVAVTTGTTVSTGPVTPSHDGSLILAVTGEGWTGPLTVGSGFTILGTPLPNVVDVTYAVGWAWLVQSTAATVNPAFSFGPITGAHAMARAAVFRATGPELEPSAKLAMDNVVCSVEVEAATCELCLDWSNDRGHTFGVPVCQEMNSWGFLTSLQWQRLGMARDRVFRLTWTCADHTALQGAWVTAIAGDEDNEMKSG